MAHTKAAWIANSRFLIFWYISQVTVIVRPTHRGWCKTNVLLMCKCLLDILPRLRAGKCRCQGRCISDGHWVPDCSWGRVWRRVSTISASFPFSFVHVSTFIALPLSRHRIIVVDNNFHNLCIGGKQRLLINRSFLTRITVIICIMCRISTIEAKHTLLTTLRFANAYTVL